MHHSVHPGDKEHYKRLIRASAEMLEPFNWEGRLLLPSGTVRWVTARSRLERQSNGEVIWDGVVLDVTELKQAQHAMSAAKEEAERANAAKSQFLSRMSHELRTPLNAILGFGQLLELSPLAGQDGQCVQYILKGGRHLLSLVDEVLDLSRVEAGELALRPAAITFGQLAEECTGLLAKLAQARGIVCTTLLSPAFDVPVWADAQRLRQVLINLISNAFKYNREHGRVELSCEQMPGGRVRCKVKDTGTGLSRESLERLFVPFERLGQELGPTEGTGLGLVVSKRLAEAMDGAVGAESELDVGSTFWVEMPTATPAVNVAAAACPAVSAVAAEPGLARSISVLYVEDNPSNQEVMRTVARLLRPGWRLFSATDGVSGLHRIREERPDVVLLDLALPGKRGDAVLAELRADPNTARIPVIMLSADATVQSREWLLSLGASEYVAKPFNVEDLLRKVDDLSPFPSESPPVS